MNEQYTTLVIDEDLTILMHLDEILQEGYEMKIQDEKKLKKELSEQVNTSTYVTSGVGKQYKDALLAPVKIIVKKRGEE